MTPIQATSAEGRVDARPGPGFLWRALALGILFGIVLIKSEVVSWYRIQEMFRFQGLHMYGILGSAVFVGMLSTAMLKRLSGQTLDREPITVELKASRGLNTRYWLGGAFFGLGWGLLGACPGPFYALIGAGSTVFVVALASALLGTWVYAALRDRLPHH